MKRSQKIFIAVMLAFFAGLILLAIDITRKTDHPGVLKRKKEAQAQDTTVSGSNSSPKSASQRP